MASLPFWDLELLRVQRCATGYAPLLLHQGLWCSLKAFPTHSVIAEHV